MSPTEALQILHGLVEQMTLTGKDRDIARQAAKVLSEAIKPAEPPVDIGGGIPEQGKA